MHFVHIKTYKTCNIHVQTPIHVVKIDIELYEWRVLRNMLTTADLKDTRNLAVEFHLSVSCYVCSLL